MTSVVGTLGQVAPNGGVLTTLYTGPSGKYATVKVIVCNRSSIDAFRIAICPGGAAIESKHYLAYETPIQANDSISSAAFTAGPGDVVRVMSLNGNLSFTLTGIEEDS